MFIVSRIQSGRSISYFVSTCAFYRALSRISSFTILVERKKKRKENAMILPSRSRYLDNV